MKATNKQKLKMKEYNRLNQDIIRKRAINWKKNNKKRAKENLKRWQKKHPHYWKEHYTGRTLWFGDKRIWLKENPRKGKCLDCGKVGLTNMHHTKYDENNPLLHTIELCVGCHQRQHRIMKYGNTKRLYKQ
ncbi:MAG: hypothetical protein ACRD94_07790 [Nitrosopumilaceae archaeon]